MAQQYDRRPPFQQAPVSAFPGAAPAPAFPVAPRPAVAPAPAPVPVPAFPVQPVATEIPSQVVGPAPRAPSGEGFRFMVFTFSADGIHICETESQYEADQTRETYLGKITMKPCRAPTFWNDLRLIIANNNPHLLVFGTQDEPSSDTYLHSKFLPHVLPGLGYRKLKSRKLSSVGTEASGIKLGRPGVKNTASRTSVYIRYDQVEIQKEKVEMRGVLGEYGQMDLTSKDFKRKAGAICTYVWHPVYGKFAFINVELPDTLDKYQVAENKLSYGYYREIVMTANKLFLLNMMAQFHQNIPLENQADNLIIFGSFNYEIRAPGKTPDEIVDIISKARLEQIVEYAKTDEMSLARRDLPLNEFNEGPANRGVNFLPTWRLARGRPQACSSAPITARKEECYSSLTNGLNMPGWPDRILIHQESKARYPINCRYYERLSTGLINESQHAAVYAIFDM